MISPSEAPGHTDYRTIANRMGRDVLERRMLKQAGIWAKDIHQGRGVFRLNALLPIDTMVDGFLRLSGLARWGHANFLDVRIVENSVALENLPSAFDGLRILQLADLHCDLDPTLIDVVSDCLHGLEYDAVALTGDYHNKIGAEHDQSLELMGRLIDRLRTPRFAVLGNHDFIEKVSFLESANVPVLLNEALPFEKNGARIWFCGVDDPHFFGTQDLEKARSTVSANEPTILLSHSPEVYREAARLGYDFMLSGHTHGGQLCLPGGWAIIKNAPIPRRLVAGPWRERGLTGYTSRGTGACGIAARFFCPPEITIHILHSAAGTY